MKSFIKYVLEPEYSKTKLLEYQNKYSIETMEVIDLVKEGIPLPIDDKDLERWLFRYEVFLMVDGDVNELHLIIEDEQQTGQADREEEVDVTSSFVH